MQEEVRKNKIKCIKCSKVKNRNDFVKDKSRKSGYHPYCKECQKPFKIKNSINRKAENIERAVEWNKGNPERRKEINKKWRENNKHLTAFYKSNRRKRVKNLSDGTVTPKNIENLPKNICGICNKKLDWLTPSKIHLDHIIPLILGGKHSITNLQWTHDKCNLSKGGRLK